MFPLTLYYKQYISGVLAGREQAMCMNMVGLKNDDMRSVRKERFSD